MQRPARTRKALFRFGLAALLLWFLPVAHPAAHADDISAWVGLRGGVSTNDGFIVGDGADEFRSDAPPSMSLGLSAWIKLGLVDLGVVFETASAAGTPAVAFNERLYSQFRLLPTLRWRFLDDGWGGATMGLGLGTSVSRLSEFLRFEIARTRGLRPEQVEQNPVGFAIAVDFGIHIMLDDDVRLVTHLGLQTTTSDMRIADMPEPYFTLQSVFHIGVEWML